MSWVSEQDNRLTGDFADYDVEADAEAFQRVSVDYRRRSDVAYSQLAWHRDISYGSHPAERLDMTRCDSPGNRVFVFFHGGWWRSGAKEGRAFLAADVLARGCHYVNVEYPLAPDTRLPDILASAECALGFVYRHFANIGDGDPLLVVGGNSAGGHLAASVCAERALERSGVPKTAVAGLLAVSGIFDMAPMRSLRPNEWLTLNADDVDACSPVQMGYPADLPVVLSYGDAEPPGFGVQTSAFANHLADQGLSPKIHRDPGADHMSIIEHVPRLLDHFVFPAAG